MSQTYKPIDIEAAIADLSQKEKVRLLAGRDFWHFESVKRAGIPNVRVSDGPNGVRGQRFFNGTPASCFPSATGIAASFDVDLVHKVGEALGDECIAKGAHILLGPTANMQRSPLGGRGFESFAEDPVLSGMVASAYINGVQSKKVSACMKHYVANDQEFERFSNDSVVSQRALREIYLEPFRLAMKHAKPHAIMSSYNKVNGLHASESPELLEDILHKEWGFDGLIMSDWIGVYSTKESLEAGLDVEMPGPTVMRGAAVDRQIAAGKIKMSTIDARVRTILAQVNLAIESGIPFDSEESSIDTPELRKLLRTTAASANVLLKNEKGHLPIQKGVKSIAVIGSNAKVPVPSGGGSAALSSTYTISALQGITDAAKSIGASVEFSTGAQAFRYTPLLDPFAKNAKVEFFKTRVVDDWLNDVSCSLPKPDFETKCNSLNCFMIDGVPHNELGDDPLCRLTVDFIPDVSGEWQFGLSSIGGSNLFIDGKLLIDNYNGFVPGEMFFNMGSEENKVSTKLEAGKEYKIEIRQSLALKGGIKASPFIAAAGLRLGAYCLVETEAGIAAAVDLAKKSEVAIVMVGTNADWESEGFDRKNIDLPGASDALVSAVLAANPNTIVVNQSGTPVAMPWVNEASTIVHSFFGGNELGNGLADVLFGAVNPSGKLSVTFPKRLEDNPAFHSFGCTSDTAGKSVYGEGSLIGYRHYQKANLEPLWHFGYGLSYTTFSLSDLSLSAPSAKGEFTATFTLTNTGSVAGAEVPQVYVSSSKGDRHSSAPQVLKAFTKVFLQPEEKKQVKLDLEKEAFSFWDEDENAWNAKAGKYTVSVATSSALKDAIVGEVELKKAFTWRGL